MYSGKNDDFKLSFDVTAVFITNNFTDSIHGDTAGKGILDAIDVARNDGIDLGIFEREIAAFHCAVLEHETFAVAKGLCTDDVTIDEANIFRVPCEVLTADFTIVHGNTIAVPKGVLRVQDTIINYKVLTILKGIFTLKTEVMTGEIMRMKEGIFALDARLFH